jgi:hypothetical protein
LRMNFFEAWSYWRKQSPLLSAEMLEYYVSFFSQDFWCYCISWVPPVLQDILWTGYTVLLLSYSYA